MYVKVVYWRENQNGYSGRPYLYQTDLDIQVGAIVCALTTTGDQKAIVIETNVSPTEIRPEWAANIKSIQKFWQ